MWNLKAGNGEVILTSESYTAEGGAQNGIESARKDVNYDVGVDPQLDRHIGRKR